MVVECTAGHFPHGDETAMREMAEYWSDKAEECRAAADYHDDRAVKSAAATRSAGGDGAAQSHRSLAAKFRAQAECNDSLAEQLYENANNTELQKWTVYGFAGLLAWQLLRSAIMFSPAGATIEMLIHRMATKTALQVVSQKTVIFIAGQSAKFAAERSTLRLAGNAGFWGGLQVGGMNVLMQAGQMSNGTRESMDWSSAQMMAISGWAGGAAGALAGKKIGERWVIPKTVALAEGAHSGLGRMLYQVGGTALVGTGAGLAGGIVGTSVGLVGQEFTLESIGETLIPAMVGGFLGAAAQGAADIRSATRATAPAAPGGARTARALAAGALAVSALTGTLHSDAPPPVDAPGGAVRNARAAGEVFTPAVGEHGPLGHNPNNRAPGPRATADLISRPAPFIHEDYHAGIQRPQGSDTAFPGGVDQNRADHIAHPTGEQLPTNEAPRIQSSHPPDGGRSPHTDVNTLGAVHPADSTTVGEGTRNHAVSGTVDPRQHHQEGGVDPSEGGRPGTNRDTSGTAEHPVTPEARPDRPVSADETGSAPQPRADEPEPAPTADRSGEPETERAGPVDGSGKHPDEAGATAPEGDRIRQDAEETLRDYAARSGPDIPEAQRLVNASGETLVEMLRGSPADADAALIEVIRRGEGKVLRWTQVVAMKAMHDGVVNMDAGEGKSLVFLAHGAREALAHGSAQVITTRDTLAGREFIRFTEVWGPLGFDIVRMNPDTALPPPTPGRPTIYIGTQQDVGFAALRENWVPGRHATIDEIDEALVHAETQYFLSDGAGRPADTVVTTQVVVAHDILQKGILTASDFGLAREQRSGPANLTESGRQMLEHRLGRALGAGELNRLNMAAAAKWEYIENVHYIRHEIAGRERVFIIDQTTHKVLYDPETATESRWHGGLAQAIEAKHGLVVQADPNSSKTITARELFGAQNYDKVTGASGTARGSATQLADLLGTDVITVDRFHDSKLEVMADTISPDEAMKLRTLAADIKQMQETGRPQLILADRNDIVAQLSKLLHPDDPGHPGRVEHIAVDAKWFLEHGTRAEAELQRIFDAAGQEGKVLVINMQGARGVDIPINAVTRELGGLHVAVTGRSALSHDIDIQAQNRAARNGDPGSVRYYISPGDNLYALTENPMVRQVVVKYAGEYTQAAGEHRAAPTVETRARLTRAENDLRGLVHPLQEEAAAQRRQATSPVDHTSGPATRAPPADRSDDDERTQHSRATNQLPEELSGGVPSAATAGQREPLTGTMGKWSAADADTLLRQAQDGHPAAAQALQRRIGPTTLQHVLTTLGWDPAHGPPAAPVQHLAQAINSAGFRAAQLDGWQVPGSHDLGGWLGEKLQNVMGDALGHLAHTQAEHFAAAQDALRRGHELTAGQLAAVGELTHAVQARAPAGAPISRVGSEDVASTASAAFHNSPVDLDAAPIQHADHAVRTAARTDPFPGGLLETSPSNGIPAEDSAPTPWFGLTFTADPGAGLLIPDTTPRAGRNQQPGRMPTAGADRTDGAEAAAHTPWNRHRTLIGAAHPAAAPAGRIGDPGRSVSAPHITESPPPVPRTSPAAAPGSQRAAASTASGLVLALARGTISGQLPQTVRDALEKDPRALQDGIEQLAPRQRQVLHHRFLLELSPAATAAALGRSTDAIRTTQYAAFLRLAELLARPVHDESSAMARKTRSTVTETPAYVRDCLVQSVRATHALGYDGATVPAKGADTWRDLEESLDSAFTRIPGSVTTDPVAHILDKVADPANNIDTAVIVVDYGTNAHSYTVTTIGDRTVVFDTNIAQPATETGPRTDRRIARVRTREEWKPSDSARIRSAFVLEFTQDSAGRLQPLRPDQVDGPNATERQRKIHGPPAAAPDGPGLPEPSKSFLQWIRSKVRPQNRNMFLRFLGGTGTGVLGGAWVSGAQLTMVDLGASIGMVGMMAALAQAGTLTGKLVAGPIADRLDNRKTLILLSTAGLVTMLAGGGWIAAGLAGAATALLAAAGLISVIDAIAGIVSRGYGKSLARTLAEKDLATSYILMERALASALGKALGPILQPIASALLFATLALAHLVHLAILRILPSPSLDATEDPARKVTEDTEDTGKKPGFFDGTKLLWKDTYLRGFLGLSLPAVFANTVGGVHLVNIVTSNDFSSWTKAALMGAVSTGIVAASKIPKSWIERAHVNWTYPASLVSLAGIMAAFATTTNPYVLWGVSAFSGMINMVQNKKFNSEVDRVVPESSGGSAWSTIDIVSALAGIAGGVSAGAILSHGGDFTGWLNTGILGATAVGAATLGYATRNRRNTPPPTEQGSTEQTEEGSTEQPGSVAPDPAAVSSIAIRLARAFRALSDDNSPEPDYNNAQLDTKNRWKPLEVAIGAPLRPHPAKGDAAVSEITETVRTGRNGIALAVVVTRKGTSVDGAILTDVEGVPLRLGGLLDDSDEVFVAYFTDNNKGKLFQWLPTSRVDGHDGQQHARVHTLNPEVELEGSPSGTVPSPDHPEPAGREAPVPPDPSPVPRSTPEASAPNRPEDFLSVIETRHPGESGPTTHRPQPWKNRPETHLTNTGPAKVGISPEPDEHLGSEPTQATPPTNTGVRPVDTANTGTAPKQARYRTPPPTDIEDALDLPHRHRNPPPWAPHAGRGVPDQALTPHDGRESRPKSHDEPIPTPWQ
ncbi:MFS transporter [Nocardia sp. NPDC050799]|uniref:MFS transporter n=1 Tax=Nocardia sp. NPDC050799 TaxID=3154842 RepID=UPI0033D2114B